MDSKQEEESNKRRDGQRRYNCLIIKCTEKGRIIGRMGDNLLLTYCPKHRKKGERILNFLVNSLMRYKLTKFLQDSKQKLFMENEPKFCEPCNQKIATFVGQKITELDNLEKTMPIDEFDPTVKEEFTDDE